MPIGKQDCISIVNSSNGTRIILSGFMLNLENLENLENRPFLQKSGKAWNSQVIFYFYPSQGKQIIKSTYHFINSCMAIRKVAVPFGVSKCVLYRFT